MLLHTFSPCHPLLRRTLGKAAAYPLAADGDRDIFYFQMIDASSGDRFGQRATAAKSASFDEGVDENILVHRAGSLWNSSKEKNKPDSWDAGAGEGAPYDWELWEEADRESDSTISRRPCDVSKVLEGSPSSSIDKLPSGFARKRRDSVADYSNGYGFPVDVWSFG